MSAEAIVSSGVVKGPELLFLVVLVFALGFIVGKAWGNWSAKNEAIANGMGHWFCHTEPFSPFIWRCSKCRDREILK